MYAEKRGDMILHIMESEESKNAKELRDL